MDIPLKSEGALGELMPFWCGQMENSKAAQISEAMIMRRGFDGK